MKSRTKLFPISLFAVILIAFTISSCNKDTDPINPIDPMDPMDPVVMITCNDGIQNGNETGIDCGGDCAACETTVAEDKENIQYTLDNMLVCVEDMTSARAIDILMRDFFQVSDGESYNQDWVDNLSSNFENVFDFQHITDNGRFNLAHHAGRYYFDHATQAWAKTPLPSGIITVGFPTTPDHTENNAVFVIDDYTDQSINLSGDDVFGPKTIHAQLNVDNLKLFELTVGNVTYAENTSFEMPVEIDASLYLDPMTISLDVTRNSSTEFFGILSMNDGSACRMSLETDLTLTDDDFENLTNDSFEKIHGKLKVGDLTVESLAGLAELIKLDEPDESTVNSLLDLDVLFKDLKIADLEYSEAEESFILYYKDATSESAGNYIDSFLEEMEAIIVEFTGEW